MKTYQKLGSVIALVLSSTSIANANIIFDNTSGGYVGGFTLNSQSWAEDDFIPTTAINNCTSQCVLNQISLSLSAVGANPVSLGLEIRDSGGSIGSLTMVTANNPGGSGLAANNLPETYEAGTSLFTPTSTINLLAGGTYWVRLTNLDLTPAFEGGDQIQWAFNSSSGSFNVNDGGDLFSVPNNSLLMKIEATPSAVPIPAAAWLMGSALLGLVSSWRRKKA